MYANKGRRIKKDSAKDKATNATKRVINEAERRRKKTWNTAVKTQKWLYYRPNENCRFRAAGRKQQHKKANKAKSTKKGGRLDCGSRKRTATKGERGDKRFFSFFFSESRALNLEDGTK